MPRHARRALSLLAVLPTLAMTAGGWAVATVDALPDHLVAGRAAELSFTVRQHGRTPLAGLRPWVEATSGGATARFEGAPAGAPGAYRVRVAVPAPGAWTLTLHHGFMNGAVTLPSIAAVRAGAPAPPLADGERGRRLFAAKGCVTCHVTVRVGPELAGRRYDAGWLARYLADPQRVRPAAAGQPTMPTLGLDARELAALVAFVNAGEVAER